jgi:2-desacetyl-2-hydroxyethyl bacteriochlorophyllide A dehydrogenase
MNSTALFFTAPHQVALCEESLPPPGPGQVLVKTRLSAISSGTELLMYRGEFPAGLAVDASIEALAGEFTYPMKYGYAAVGEVIELGPDIHPAWEGCRVFAFQPHASYFLAQAEDLLPLPEGIDFEEAAFLPNMETAVNLVMDGRPMLGERVAVFGQGIVGLLTTALLARFPLADLVTFDRFPLRREASLALGAFTSLDPADPPHGLRQRLPEGADLSYEVTGAPEALDQAIAATGFAGRVVVGSWYGAKPACLDLGGSFHRSRIRLISSQVSSVDPELSGRWNKDRRFQVVWAMLERVRPSSFITHRLPLAAAAEAYRLLDERPWEALQVIFTYDS